LRRFYDWYRAVKVPLHLAALFSLIFGLAVWGIFAYSFRASIGETKIIGIGVGVYWDANCDNRVTNLSWGEIVVNPLQPNVSKQLAAYVRNEKETDSVLSLSTSKWDPAFVENYISLGWDYEGQVLASGDTLQVTFILFVNSSLWFQTPRVQHYSFDIVVSSGSP
jgi:hypothetical protein